MAAIFDDAFDALLDRLVKDWEIPGISIAIVPLSTSQPVFKSYGVAYGDESITPKVCPPQVELIQTRFPICSLTKPFTALTLLRLLDAHNIFLSAPISDVISDFHMRNEVDGAKVTFAHALRHVTGVETADVMYTDPAAKRDMVSRD